MFLRRAMDQTRERCSKPMKKPARETDSRKEIEIEREIERERERKDHPNAIQMQHDWFSSRDRRES